MGKKSEAWNLAYEHLKGLNPNSPVNYSKLDRKLQSKIKKILGSRKRGSKSGENSGSNQGNFSLSGISKLKNTGSQEPSQKKLDSQKRAEDEAKKMADQIKRALNNEFKKQNSEIEKKKNRKRERIELAELNQQEQEVAAKFSQSVKDNVYSKEELMKNFCRLKNEGIRDNIVVNSFIPKFMVNLQEINVSLKNTNNLDLLEKNYFEFEARYRKIFKIFYDLQIKFYNIFQIDLKDLLVFLGIEFSELDEFITYINENGFNFAIVQKLEEWINTFKTRASEKFEDLDIELLQEKYVLETESDVESILKEFFLRFALLDIKEELSEDNYKKIIDKIYLITHQDKVSTYIVQLRDVLKGIGNIKTFYEKYDKGYFTSEEKEEVKELVVKLGEELESLKLKYDEDIRAKVTEKKKEELLFLDNKLQNLVELLTKYMDFDEAQKKELIKEKEEDIIIEKVKIEKKFEKIKKNIDKDYENSQDKLFNAFQEELTVIHKNATARFVEHSKILKRYFELKKKFEKILGEKLEGGNGNSTKFQRPTNQKKKYRRAQRKKYIKNKIEQKEKPKEPLTKTLAQILRDQEEQRNRKFVANMAAAVIKRANENAKKLENAARAKSKSTINANLKNKTLSLKQEQEQGNNTAIAFTGIKNFLIDINFYYTKFFYPLEFLLAEYKKIVTDYNELFTDVLNTDALKELLFPDVRNKELLKNLTIKDKLYFNMKIYNRLKSKDPSRFSCTLAYLSFQILNIDEIFESFEDDDTIQENFIQAFRDYCKNTEFPNDISANAPLAALKQSIPKLIKGEEVEKFLIGTSSSGITRNIGKSGSSALVEFSPAAAEVRIKYQKNLENSKRRKEENETSRKLKKISNLFQIIKKKNSNNRQLTLQELREIRAMKEGLNKELEGFNSRQDIKNYLIQMNINKRISNEQRRLRELEIVGILNAANNLPNDTPILDIKKTLDKLIKIKESNSDILTESNNEIIDELISKFMSIYNKSNNSLTFQEKYEEYNKLNKNTEDLEELKKLSKKIELLLKIQGIPKNIKKQLEKEEELIKRRIALSNRKPQTSREKSKTKKPPTNTEPSIEESNAENISKILANLQKPNSNNDIAEPLIGTKGALKTNQKEKQKLMNEEKRIKTWLKKFEKYQILYDSFKKDNQEVNKNNFDTEIKEFLLIVTNLYCIFKNRKPFIQEDFELSASEIKDMINSIQTNNKNEFISELIEKLNKEGMNYLKKSTDSKSADKRFIVWKRESKMNKLPNINKLFKEIKNKNSNNRQLTLQELRNIKEMKKVLTKKLKIMGNDAPQEIKNYLEELNINRKISEEKRRIRKSEIVEILNAATKLSNNNTSHDAAKDTLTKLITIKQSNNSILTESNKEIIDELIVRFESIKKNKLKELQNTERNNLKRERRKKEKERRGK
jgi:hypothetical protein